MIYRIQNGKRCVSALSRLAPQKSWWKVWRPILANWSRRTSIFFQLPIVPSARQTKYWHSQPNDMQTSIIRPSWNLYGNRTKSMILPYKLAHLIVIIIKASDLIPKFVLCGVRVLFMSRLGNLGLCGAPFTFGQMLFQKISVIHPIIHCSTNFCHFASNMPRIVNFISK